jgi:dienelactone hydrolase
MTAVGRRSIVKMLALGLPGLAGCAQHLHGQRLSCPATVAGQWETKHFPVRGGRTYLERSGAGRPVVVVLHEILGLSDKCVTLGNRLWDSGFSVALPVLFGQPRGYSFFPGYFLSCGSRQFSCAASNKSSAIMPSLLEFCEHMADAAPGRRIGVIGMCLTGAFPIWLMRSNVVAAPVLCQPTIPFSLFGPGEPTALGLSAEDLRLAIRQTHVAILGMRYTADRRCPMQRFAVLSELFGRRFRAYEIPSGIDGAPDGHSVLTGDCWPDAYARAVDFLREQLTV